jgi:ketosteroid isomerase-like protein
MKHRFSAAAAAALLGAALLSPAPARARNTAPPSKPHASDALRSEVQKFVKAYVEAQNKLDASAMMEMVSRDPSVASITMGEVLRGWDAIRDDVDEMVGSNDDMTIALGTIDVVPLGSGFVLAFAPCSIAYTDDEGPVQTRGALSLVLEKSSGHWKVLHEHASIQVPDDDQDDGPDPADAMPAVHRHAAR